MTPNDKNQGNDRLSAAGDHEAGIDRILDHNRLQLSALVDGELQPNEARFLLRRLQHDAELRGCWERWQLCGDVLRGRHDVVLPAGFASRVAVALAVEPGHSPASERGPRWLRWSGGAAVAASVAMIALLLGRHSPEVATPVPAPEQVIATIPSPPVAPLPTSTLPTNGSPADAGKLVSVLAVAEVPRRLNARRSRGQSQRAAVRSSLRPSIEAPVAVSAAAAGANQSVPVDPFSNAEFPNRPWPRALLPGASVTGAFTVDYGLRAGTSPSFYPFQPPAHLKAPTEIPVLQKSQDNPSP